MSRRGARVLGAAAATTIAVRLVGLGSLVFAVSRLGAGRELDAFLIALIPPALLAVPFASAVELTYGPLYAQSRAAADGSSARLARWLGVRCLRVGLVAVVVLVGTSPLLVRLCSPGAGAERHRLATELSLLLFPTVLPSIVGAWTTTILIGAGRLQVPIVAQICRPIAMIVALTVWSDSVVALSAAALVGAVLEVAVGLAAVRLVEPAGLPSPHADAGPLVGETPRLLPLTLSSGVSQAVPAVDQAVAAGIGPGKLVILSVAARFYDVAKAALIQPSSRLAQNRLSVTSGLRRQVNFEVRRAAAIGAVSAVAVAVLAPLAIHGVFRRGEFTSANARSASGVALVLAVALIPFAIANVLSRVLVMHRRSRLVASLLVGYLGLNVVLDVLFADRIGVAGIALATLISLTGLVVAQGIGTSKVLNAVAERAVERSA